jgi:kynurenine formamidase
MGAVNLMTPRKRVDAARLVKTGRTVPLGRVFEPDQHFVRISERGGGGSVVDYYGFMYHGVTVTHVDALCHVWDRNGMWNGRDPAKELDTRGARFADITAFGAGLITRGVLLDVPRHRGTAHVALGRPVEGKELQDIARAQGVTIEAGDALLIHSGREALVRSGTAYAGAASARPGLHASCARTIRDWDVSLLGWDMHDAMPDQDGLPWPVHGVLYSYGVALLDNALLEPLAAACAEERRYEFMFMALPLRVARGTGSPVNPIAMF